MLENKLSCPREREIEMLCFSSRKNISEKEIHTYTFIYIYVKREGERQGGREERRGFCKSSGHSRKVRRNL